MHADLPSIGPKKAHENLRDSTEEQLKDGERVIGPHVGSHFGASQSGMTYGTRRRIF